MKKIKLEITTTVVGECEDVDGECPAGGHPGVAAGGIFVLHGVPESDVLEAIASLVAEGTAHCAADIMRSAPWVLVEDGKPETSDGPEPERDDKAPSLVDMLAALGGDPLKP